MSLNRGNIVGRARRGNANRRRKKLGRRLFKRLLYTVGGCAALWIITTLGSSAWIRSVMKDTRNRRPSEFWSAFLLYFGMMSGVWNACRLLDLFNSSRGAVRNFSHSRRFTAFLLSQTYPYVYCNLACLITQVDICLALWYSARAFEAVLFASFIFLFDILTILSL